MSDGDLEFSEIGRSGDGREPEALAGLLAGLRSAHKDAGGLSIAYESAMHGAFAAANPTPALAKVNALFLEQYALAEPHVRREFVARVLTGDLEHALPFAINGVPFDVAIPDAAEALAFVVSNMDWHTLGDESEAEDQAMDVAEAMFRAADRIRKNGLADEATASAYEAKARRLPAVADLVGLDDLGLPSNACTVAARLLSDLEARRAPDALTEGLMRSLLRWINGKVLETMAGKDVLAMRKDAGLTQQDLADRVDITRQHLVRLETGKTPVSARLGRAIVAACRAAQAAKAATASAGAEQTTEE